MRKFTLMLIAAFMAVFNYSQAASPVKRVQIGQQFPAVKAETPVPMNTSKASFSLVNKAQTKARAQKRVVAAADLAGKYLWEYKQANERAEDPSTIETTPGSSYVTITATDENTVTISGMFPKDLTGVINEGTLVIERQSAGTSNYGDYDVVGLFYYAGDETYEAGWYTSSITGTIGADGVITFNEWFMRILVGGQYDGYSLTPYWVAGSTLTPSEGPAEVVVPLGLETDEYSVTARNYKDDADVSGSVFIGFDGNDVYMQGLCTYLPQSWVKGVLNGNTITFAKGQYFGNYGNTYDMFLNTLMGEDVVFTYDEKAGTLTAQNEVFLTDNDQYYFDSYRGAVFKKVVEKAATPANPSITSLENGNYGWFINFNIPSVDTDGNGLVTSKLSYQIFTDVEKEVSALVFTPETHTKLTENMSVIPFGFTENYDFYNSQIYLNELYSADWNKIGIKSIYTGGGETHETEIQWYTIKPYAVDSARSALTAEIEKAEALLADETLTEGREAFGAAISEAKAVNSNEAATAAELNAAVTALKAAEAAFIAANKDPLVGEATWVASQQGYSNAMVISKFSIDENISATVDKGTGSTDPAYYNTGSALRFYGKNVMTIAASEKVAKITKIVLTFASANNTGAIETTPATYTLDEKTGTWVGEADTITFTNTNSSGHARIQQIDVTYTLKDGEDPQDDVLVTLPQGVEAQEYTLTASGYASGQSGLETLSVEKTAYVAFDGNDVYVSGLAYWFKDAYVKGKLADGKVTFKSGQYVGEDEYGKEYLMGVNVDSTTNKFILVNDFVFDFDADAKTLTLTSDAFIGESGEKEEPALYTYLETATYTPGGVVLPDVVELPDGAEVKTWYLKGSSYNGAVHAQEVGVAFVGNDIYLQGLCTYLPEAWVKGTINGTTATFASGQFYGQYLEQYNLFFVGYNDDTKEVVDVNFTYDADAKTLTSEEGIYILLNNNTTEPSFYDYYQNVVISEEKPEVPEVVVAPEDLVTEPYYLTAFDTYYSEEVSRQVNVGFYGENEVYIQGLSEYTVDAWVKGTLENNVLSIPETYMGVYSSLFGDSELTLTETEFTYDAATNTFSSAAGYQTTDGQYAYDEVENVVIAKIVEIAATPADPEVSNFSLIDEETGEYVKYPNVRFNIPAIDTNDKPMVQDKLTYTIYIVDKDGVEAPLTLTTDLYTKLTENMTEIPYAFTDNFDIYSGGSRVYLNQDPAEIASWKKIGVKSTYRGAGEEHSSNTAWFDIEEFFTGINTVAAAEGEARYFDLQGRAVENSAKGLLIKQVRDAQGNVKTVKVVRK